MLRYRLVMTLVALPEHQLLRRSSTDSEGVRSDVLLPATKAHISIDLGKA